MEGMLPEDLYALSGADDPSVGPDGSVVALVQTSIEKGANAYRSSIWVVPADASGPARRFTFGGKQDAAPRWSPDGGSLAFVSDRGGDSKQLYVIPSAGGEARQLTDGPEDVGEVAWSPDGSRLAFSTRVRDRAYATTDDALRAPRRITRLQFKLDSAGWICDRPAHIFTVPADGSGTPVQLTHGDFEDTGPAWSPDGSQIAFSSARHGDWDLDFRGDIFTVPAGGGDPRRITDGSARCEAPAWSPDGATIAFRCTPDPDDYPRHTQIAVLRLDSGSTTVLTGALDRNCGPYPALRPPLWDRDRVVFGVEDHGSLDLYGVPADGSGPPEALVSGRGYVTGYDVAGGLLAYCLTTPGQPAELYASGIRLTGFTRPFCTGRRLVQPERFTAMSRDRSEVEAWIMRPPEAGRGAPTPLLLNIHGGPYSQYGTGFFDEFHVYTGAGYAVVFSNPRGSSGYGEAWARAIKGPVKGGPGHGSVDYDDVMTVTDEALRRYPTCDPDRMGVMGGSYGGFLTSWIVGHTNRFRAACSERALNDWMSDWGSSDIGFGSRAYVGAYQFEAPDAYRAMSPATYAADIDTPLLILHSENDLRCNVEQAEQLFTTLRVLKRPVEMVRFPAESHELSRSGSPRHRVMRFEVILEWFDRHLKP